MRGRACLALLVLALALPAGAGGEAARPILLGATAPLSSDPAAAALVRGAEAYFRWVNARGGVHGRPIAYRLLDDAGDPAAALEATRQLVEREGVLAMVGSPGSATNVATRGFLERARVPQLFVGSAAGVWTRRDPRHAWSIGYRPSLAREGEILGRYLARTRPGARVAVLATAGPEGGEPLAGLRRGLARSSVAVVAVRRHDPALADPRPDAAALRAAGADVLALFVPAAVGDATAAAVRRLGWRPSLVAPSDGAAAEGVVSPSFLKDPTDPRWAADPGMRLCRAILARHAPGAVAREAGHVEGMAVAHTTVELLRALGPDPSRAGLMARVRSLRSASNPFLLPGIVVRTSATDSAPVEQAMLRRRVDRAWRAFGGLWR